MRLVLQQKFRSFGDAFVVRDEEGNALYQIRGEVFRWGDKLRLEDMHGRELAVIEQELLSWGPSYQIERPGHPTVSIEKEHFTFFYCKFTIDGPGREDFEAEGEFFDHEYRIAGPRGIAAEISKRWFTWADSYGIEIADGEDEILQLAIALVIDLVCHDEDGRSH